MVGRDIYDEVARMWKVVVVISSSVYYPTLFLERLRMTTRSLNQDRHYPDQDSKWTSSK
jgi:hypothetical protein